MKIRRADDRGYTKLNWLDSWHTFSFDTYHDEEYTNFGPLRVINEDIVQPGQGFGMHPHRDMEILTYVIEGALQHNDSLGTGSIIRPGEIQRMSAGTGITHSEYNASKDKPVHLLQIWLFPSQKNLAPGYEQTNIEYNSGSGWQLIASNAKHSHAVQINQDANVYIAKLAASNTLPIKLLPGRLGWLQIIKGNISIDKQPASKGDGVALEGLTDLTLEAKQDTEILFFDLSK